MRVVFLGLPGSGKGTQARFLARRFSLPFIGMGDLLRQEIKNQTPLGHRLKPLLEKGDFPSDDLVMDIFLKNVLSLGGFVAEGVPRSHTQAVLLSEALARRSLTLDYVFYLELDEKIALERLLSRYMCFACGATYGPKDGQKGVCDFCGQKEFVHREDDIESVIEKRLKAQKIKDQEVLSVYDGHAFFHRINSCLPVQRVEEEILNCMKN